MKSEKGAMQMSFAWIFAIIAGIFILGLAIFAIERFTGIESTASDAETSKGIGVLLNPLEISFESGKTTSFSLATDSRIYSTCSDFGDFGTQRISVSQKVYGKWSETDIQVSFINKYIFANEPVEGKNFVVFSKPFNMPFKIADLIYMISKNENYCFINPPRNIEEEISNLNLENLRHRNCFENSIRVCFDGGQNCDVNVNHNTGLIEKNGESYYFSDDSLMYAGIFAEKDLYECQVKRLVLRGEQISLLYEDKVNFLQQRIGCGSEVRSNLAIFNTLLSSFQDSFDLRTIKTIAGNLDNSNDFGECKLW